MGITVGQFQEIYKINKSDIESEEKLTEMVAVLSGKTVLDIEEMPLPEFKKLAAEISDLLKAPLPEGKASRTIAGYYICYEPYKLNRGQYVTVNHFLKMDVIENCHLILASLTYDPKTKKHQAEKHTEIAEKIQGADLSEVIPATVFFCQLFTASIKSLENYFLRELVMKGMNPEKARSHLMTLMKGLDGYTTLNRLQTLRA